MKVYETKNIRNVAVLGHGSCGKTTLVEAIAFQTGAVSRMGKVTDGNTISDFDKEEQKRQFSISASLVPVEFEGTKINLIDAPGYFDFVGEAQEACAGADAAIIVINGKSGVEVGTQKAWDLCEKYGLPCLFFVTNMDDEHANFAQITADLQDKYGTSIAPFHVAIREGEKFVGFVNVVSMKGRKFAGAKYEDCDIPADLEDEVSTSREALMEAVAETSEEFMERYFEEGADAFTYEEVAGTIREHVTDRGIIPVMMGSGFNNQGVNALLNAIIDYFPSPENLSYAAKKGDEDIKVKCDASAPFSAKVFKTVVDPFIGKYSLIKMITGSLKPGDSIFNVTKDREDRASKVYLLRGKESIEVEQLNAGDIGALAKIDSITTGDSLGVKGATVEYEKPKLSIPYTYKAYHAKNKADEDKIAAALTRLLDEDKTMRTVNDSENHQTLLYAIGDQQMDVMASRMANRYKVEIELEKPKIAYRETIRKEIRKQGKYKKQTGGSGQYGDVHIIFEPSNDLETPYIFEEKVVGGAVPKNYFPAVEKGIQESVLKGRLAGYPVVGMKATLVDGSYHPVDSSELAFKQAAILAYKAAFPEASPIILEPIVTVKVTVPDAMVGDVMGDMNKRRGRVMGMDHISGGNQVVTAEVPMAEMYGYGTDLRAMTGGMGDFEYEFARYEQTPGDVQKKIIDESEVEE